MRDATGEQYGNWLVVKDLGMGMLTGTTRRHWVRARCKCGKRHEVRLENMRAGLSTQCVPCGNQREKQERLCRFCGEDRPSKFTSARGRRATTCDACLRRVARNGRCQVMGCGFPLYVHKGHECGKKYLRASA